MSNNISFRVHGLRIGLLLTGLTIQSPAHAYLGPGSGLTAIGSLIALVGVIGLGIVGFVWYPLKRLIAKLRGDKPPAQLPPGDKCD